ncbi:hypothetical protein CBR_g88898, partial [Chara braunii]
GVGESRGRVRIWLTLMMSRVVF